MFVQEGGLTWYNKSWNKFYSPMAGNGDGASIIKNSDHEFISYSCKSVLSYYQTILASLTLNVSTI
jgi:hypothetical protein